MSRIAAVERPAPVVGYILKGFPRLSEPFIANEIHLLEQLGLELELYSIKAGERGTPHAVVSRIKAPVAYVPQVPPVSDCSLLGWLVENLHLFTAAHGRLLRRRPWVYLRALGGALSMYWRYRYRRFGKPKKAIIKEFLQAGHIADAVIARGRAQHLHGHFCHEATTVTWFVSRLTGIDFSFTAHAKDLYERKLNPGDLLERKLESARFVTTCTKTNHQHLQALFPRFTHVHTVYHGLDTELFRPQHGSRDSGPANPLLVSVGRFVEKKGFPYLVEACAELAKRGHAFRCVIVGERGEDYERVRHKIDELGLEQQIELRPPVSQEALRAIYAEATVFALPCHVTDSGDRDGIPNVVAEAMAMGVPVVCSRVSGIPELVEDGVNGKLAPPRDAIALADALEEVLVDPRLRARLGEAARETICDCFDSSQTTSSLKDLFMNVLRAQAA